MKPRTATVMESTVATNAVEIRFRGAWLQSLGFHPGMTVAVESPEPGRLLLTVKSPPQLTAADFHAALAPFEKLGL